MPRDTARFPVAVGDPVKIVGSRLYNNREIVIDGTVLKVGRKLVTIGQNTSSRLMRQEVFRLETGRTNAGVDGWAFMTLEEYEVVHRREVALAALARHNLGPIVTLGEVKLDTETLERMVQIITDPEPGH